LRDNIKDKDFVDIAKVSMGLDLSEEDGEMLKLYAEEIKNLYKLKEKTEKYIEVVMKEVAPNFSELAGPLLAARLISLVGGLDKLAKKPSSTIQLLGSEKALFRYLSGKGRSPKHGILFQSPYIQKAPMSKRGKIARILSSKLNIAVKMDYYGTEDRSKKLKEELEVLLTNALKD
jgi:nucleolar protein 56